MSSLDNLIPLHVHLNQHQLAGWPGAAPAESGCGTRLLADVAIPMDDGVRLAADVYVPARPGRYPVVVQFSAYNLDLHSTGAPKGTNEIGSPRLFTDRGYVQVVITARGVGRSEGEPVFWHCDREIDDVEACIAWAAEQPWSSGDVVMFGTSYYGMIQPAVAARRPPALRAFFCNEICTDLARHVFRYGGHPNADFFSLWAGANFTRSGMGRHIPPVLRALASWVLAREFPYRLLRHRIDAVMQSFKTRRGVHPSILSWILAMIAGEEQSVAPGAATGPFRELPSIDLPFVVVQNRGLIGLHQFGSYDLFARAGTAPEKKWLIVGPAEYELPVTSWQLEALAFFDHVVKGIDNGYDRLAHVRYFRDGSRDWGHADAMPPKDAQPFTLYLDRGERLTGEAPKEGRVTWLAAPRGLAILPELTELEPERRVFRFPIERTTTLFGPATVSLEYSCNEIDSYVIARLDRVDARGQRTPLGFAHLRPAIRTPMPEVANPAEIPIDPRRRTPLVPNEPVELRFSMTPLSVVLSAGDALELTIASRSEQIFVSVSEGFVLPDAPVPYFARNSLHLGPKTRLELTEVAA